MNDLLQEETSRIIAAMNDTFRRSFVGGIICITIGVQNLGSELVDQLLSAVKSDDYDNDDTDHSFGIIRIGEHVFFWQIYYYDLSRQHCSVDPSDPERTTRVLAVTLLEEYAS